LDIIQDWSALKALKESPNESTQHSVDITTELKEEVQKGLPQFVKGGKD